MQTGPNVERRTLPEVPTGILTNGKGGRNMPAPHGGKDRSYRIPW
jgi:hypothetical protein